MSNPSQKNTDVIEKLEIYQPGVNELRRQLLEVLPRSQVNSLVSPMDYELALFEVATYLRHTGKKPEDAKNLFYFTIDQIVKKHNLDPDIGEAAKLRIGKNPQDLETLTTATLEENPQEDTDNPANHHLNGEPNDFFNTIQNSTESAIKEINKRFKKTPVGEKIVNFEDSAPIISTTPTSSATGMVVTGSVIGNSIATTKTSSALTVLSGTKVANITPSINYGNGFVGFSVSNNAELVSQFSNTASFQSYFGAGIFKQVPQSAVAQTFGISPQPNTTYVAVTEKYFKFYNASPKSLGSVMDGIASRSGVTLFSTGEKTAANATTKTAASAAGKAASAAVSAATKTATTTALATTTTATRTATGTADGDPVGAIIGAVVGYVVSLIPKIIKFIKEYIAPVIGGMVLLFTGSIPAALLATGGTFAASSIFSFFGFGKSTGVSVFGAKLSSLFNSLVSDFTTNTVVPIIITVLSLPIIIAFFLLIINSGAYVVPPAGRHSGPGGLYPSCWPVDSGTITQLPPHGLYHTLDAFDIGLPNGSTVYASHDGTAHVYTDPHTPTQGSYGNYIKIESPEGFCTLYGHLASFSVSDGQDVLAGDEIGASDNTGTSTGPHLHYEYQEPCQQYAGNIPGDNRIINYVPDGWSEGGSLNYPGSCFASQQGGSTTNP
jgi:murein DD-endopeptidase MepM/ murein hydrolase activator NlpD